MFSTIQLLPNVRNFRNRKLPNVLHRLTLVKGDLDAVYLLLLNVTKIVKYLDESTQRACAELFTGARPKGRRPRAGMAFL